MEPYSIYNIPLLILTVIYLCFIWYSEIDNPNNIIDEANTASYIKWGILLLILIIQLSLSISIINNKENTESQTITVISAVLLTWCFVFLPSTIFLYYFTEKCNGFNGKASFDLNTVAENVIGYAWVANGANKIFARLKLLESDIQNDEILSESIEQRMEWNNALAKSINQYNIFNFNNMWDTNYKNLYRVYEKYGKDKEKDKNELEEIKKILFDLVKRKYIIGKCTWFLYNSIMSIIIISFLIII
jgi:hypothetical protein